MAELLERDLRLGFRFAEDDRADSWFRGEAARVLGRIVQRLRPERLTAVILSGSAARGEAGLLQRDGRAFPVADLDLYVVACSEEAARELRDARHGLLRELKGETLQADVGISTAGDLAALPDTIGNLSLKAGGRVVWGEPGALELVRRIQPDRIPRSDALNLVLNRAAEEMAALRRRRASPRDEGAAFAAFYRAVKTTTDLGLALLMSGGVFDARYGGRGERVRSLLDGDVSMRAALPASFVDSIAEASRWKRAPRWSDLAGHLPGTPGYPERAEETLRSRIAALTAFLSWYAGGPAGALEADVLGRLARSEPLRSASREWWRYAKASGPGRRAAWRRLASGRVRPSPRLSVQLAALALFLSAGRRPERPALERAARLLPGPVDGLERDEVEDAALVAWGREIMNWREE